MAMRRLILNNFTHSQRSLKPQTWTSDQLLRRLTSATGHPEQPQTKEVSVSDTSKKPKSVSPHRRRRRSLWSSENTNQNFPPLSGLGNAIIEAATNMNRLLENLSPTRLIRRFREKDDSYIIKYQMPGLSKEDVKITVEDGMLLIRGEREHEEQGSDDDEVWSAATYGYYNTSLMLPEDAKADEIKAEMKDGVLHVVIPKDETKKKNIKEVRVG